MTPPSPPPTHGWTPFAGAAEAPVAGSCACSGCGRMPLVGERVTLYMTGEGRGWACDECLGAGVPAGQRLATERVRSIAGMRSVRRVA